jgi:hypothetical protein
MKTTEPADKAARIQTISHNARQYLSLDYEMISVALDIEINTEMSPIRISRVLQARLTQMTKKERSNIPMIVWDYMDALDVMKIGFTSLNPHSPKQGEENHRSWIVVEKENDDGDSMIVTNKKLTPARFLTALQKKPRFLHWIKAHNAATAAKGNGIVIRTPTLSGLTQRFCQGIVVSW